MFGLESDREILRIHFQRRIFLAGSHAARPRYSGRLRPAQVRNRKTVGPRTSGASRHGDDGLRGVLVKHRLYIRHGRIYSDRRRLDVEAETSMSGMTPGMTKAMLAAIANGPRSWR